MSNQTVAPPPSWRHSRYGFAAFCLLSLLAGWFVLRCVLLCAFTPPGLPPGNVAAAFLGGFGRDLFAALLETLPLLGWMLLVPDRQFRAGWHRGIFLGGCWVLCLAQVFLLFTEFFFFEEFR